MIAGTPFAMDRRRIQGRFENPIYGFMKSKSLILLVLSLGFGIVAAIGISQVLNARDGGGPVESPRGPVLLASADLSLYDKLTEENVKLENWTLDTIPENAVTSLEEIADMVTTTRLSPGIPIVRGAIQHKTKRTGPVVPEGMKVVAVRVAADDTIGNLLRPGHKVDVIGVFKGRERNSNRTTTTSRTFLKALEVYSIGNKTQHDSTENPSGNSNASSIVGLLVTEKQSEALVFVQDTGSIKLVLRGDSSENDGGVEQLEDIRQDLLEVGEGADPGSEQAYKPKSVDVEMIIIRGGDIETTKFNENGTPIQPSGGGQASGSGSRESSGGDYGDSSDYGDVDRGIDDDQYRGE